MRYESKTFSGDHTLDGNEYVECTFNGCKLIYQGGHGWSFSAKCIFSDCRFDLSGAALKTVQTIRAMYHGNFQDTRKFAMDIVEFIRRPDTEANADINRTVMKKYGYEMAGLPHKAVVMILVRAAKRVHHLWGDSITAERRAALREMVNTAQQVAAGTASIDDAKRSLLKLEPNVPDKTKGDAFSVFTTAQEVASATLAIACDDNSEFYGSHSPAALLSALLASTGGGTSLESAEFRIASAFEGNANSFTRALYSAIQFDIDNLRKHAPKANWTSESLFGDESFGPLWPYGNPIT